MALQKKVKKTRKLKEKEFDVTEDEPTLEEIDREFESHMRSDGYDFWLDFTEDDQ